MDDSRIPLAELVEAVRRELQVSHSLAQGEPLQFEVGDLELDLEVMTSTTGEGSAGLSIWVVNAGGKLASTDASTQRVKIKLSAVGPDGGKYKVSDAAGGPVRTT